MTGPLPKSSNRFNIVRADTLKDIPPPEWLVQSILPKGGLVLAFGERGSAKSFGMLDLAASIATGKDWHGHPVKQANVVYVVAEGTWGFCPRIGAWMQYHDTVEIPGFYVGLMPVQLHRPRELQAFVAEVLAAVPQPVGLFVFDTLARCFVGGDEVNAIDMGMVVSSAGALQEQFGATVALTHHTARQSGEERGHTSLGGASDTMLRFKSTSSKGATFSLTCAKQKDAAPFEPMSFRLLPVGSSCILKPDDDAGALAIAELDALKALDSISVGDPVKASAWEKACDGISRATFFRIRRALLDRGFVSQDANLYSSTSVGKAFLYKSQTSLKTHSESAQ